MGLKKVKNELVSDLIKNSPWLLPLYFFFYAVILGAGILGIVIFGWWLWRVVPSGDWQGLVRVLLMVLYISPAVFLVVLLFVISYALAALVTVLGMGSVGLLVLWLKPHKKKGRDE